GAVELHAVPGIKHDRNVGVPRLLRELTNGPAQIGADEVAAKIDDVETDVLDQLGDGRRVVRRVGEPSGVLIGRVADDERDALLRPRIAAAGAPERKREKEVPAPAHACAPTPVRPWPSPARPPAAPPAA